MIYKRNFLIAIILLVSISSIGQKSDLNFSTDYKTALGLKFYPGGISLKHFAKENTAIELIGYFWERGSRITGLYEIHKAFPVFNRLKWYFGPGVHVGFYNDNYGGKTIIGVDGVIGLDYKFKGAPINISLDWQPSFEFGTSPSTGFTSGWGGMGVRFTF